MSYFKRLSIRGKLFSILAVVVFLQLIVSVACIHFLRSMNERLNHVADVDAEKIKLAGRINSDLLEIHRAQKNLILSRETSQVERFKNHLTQYRTVLQDDLSALERLADEEDLRIIGGFKIPYAEFLTINHEIEGIILKEWENPREGDPRELNAQASTLSMGKGREAYDSASGLLSDLIKRTGGSLDQSQARSQGYFTIALLTVLVISAGSILIAIFVGLYTAGAISRNIDAMAKVAEAIAGGNLETPVQVERGDETGRLAASIRDMQTALRRARDEFIRRDWLKTGIARLNEAMAGRVDVNDLCSSVVLETATYLDAPIGAVFVTDGEKESPSFSLAGRYACAENRRSPERFKAGSGLVGQAALASEPMIVRDVPSDYIKVECALGEASPGSLLLCPFLFDGKVNGVIELGFLKEPGDLQLEYLKHAMSAIGINVETALSRQDLSEALARSQTLAEELHAQQEELRHTNQQLEEQTHQLEQSQQRLEAQQRELEESNQRLESQKHEIEEANQALERTRRETEEKARQLEIASKYKSELLANMSHELRTPLNSMLLLAKLLEENKEGNLGAEQIKSARIIHSSGEDLLSLINEILDLSRIEAGRIEIEPRPVSVRELAGSIEHGFEHVAGDKGLLLEVSILDGCPAEIETDRMRIEQVLRNLVSNGVKFTEKGSVRVSFGPCASPGLSGEDQLEIAVADTGIGIPADKREIIFEAFQQAEGGTARKYGGTGLGLSISRELVKLLGGRIRLESEEGSGSTFTVTLPLRIDQATIAPLPKRHYGPQESTRPVPACALPDDRNDLEEGDTAILIIEDDPAFAGALVKLCHEKGHKCLVSSTGEEGLNLAAQFSPKAILLDIRLPRMDGWSVLESLKESPELRHIPVHILSVEEQSIEAVRRGAVGYLHKPASKEDLDEVLVRLEDLSNRDIRRLLVVEDEDAVRESIVRLIADGGDVEADEAANGREAIEALRSKAYDCMILDLGLPDMDGLDVLRKTGDCLPLPPVIVYTARELTKEEEIELRRCTESVIVKGVKSEARLLDEASLFMHRAVARMPEEKRQMISNLHDTDAMLRGKQVLIVDDDMRNVFALARVLEERGIITIKAENGERALEMLQAHPSIDLVLMDIMMPVMDGYETMRRIREQERFKNLPILALTAKAMKEDRERCMEAGASDYLAKPVDLTRLLSLMRVWLYRGIGE